MSEPIFSQEDADKLRKIHNYTADQGWLNDLAARIEALVPKPAVLKP